MMDVTEHPTGDGKVYLAVVLDAFSRMVVGWSIADHMRTELVVDALQMAIWRRRPPAGTVAHSDHGAQYTSWAFGRRLRAAGLLGSMGSDRRLLRQLRRRELLRDPAARAARPAPLGRPRATRRRPSSTGSKAGTTRAGGTPTATCSAPSTTKPPTPPSTRHQHLTKPGRPNGAAGLASPDRCRGQFPALEDAIRVERMALDSGPNADRNLGALAREIRRAQRDLHAVENRL